MSKTKVSLWAAGLMTAAAVLACGVDGPERAEGEPDVDVEQEQEQEPTEAAGPTGRDGQFEFTVHGMECDLEVVTDEYGLQHQPQDQYCQVDLRVDNIGDNSQGVDSGEFYAIGADGTKYNSSSDLWTYQSLNPGQGMDVTVVYDVPEDADLVELELHDSVFSNGVIVGIP